MFGRGDAPGLRVESSPEEGEAISRQTAAGVTTPAESTEEEHVLWSQVVSLL